MNEFGSSLEDLVPWVVDRLAIPAMEPDNCSVPYLFNIIYIGLDENLSHVAIERSFPEVCGILRELCSKNWRGVE